MHKRSKPDDLEEVVEAMEAETVEDYLGIDQCMKGW